MSFAVGQVVGEYEIVGVLGRGGLGAVYEARHVISRRLEAMKVLLPQTDTADMVERFRREIQMLASLSHPNIAALHHAFYSDAELIMIMELVRGEDLRTYSQRTPIPLPVLVEFTAQVLAALEYAHGRGVVHRDIKPANFMVSAEGVVKVLDFGIAVDQGATHLTAAGALIGSLTHMSPEQIRAEEATPQSDLYALGVTLYELIAGQLPLQGATPYLLMMAHLNQVPVPLLTLRPELPAYLSEAVARALEKEPVRRFGSAAEMLGALRPGNGAAPVSSMTKTLPAATWQRPRTDELNRPVTSTGALPLDKVIQHLASFIGPIAKIVVNRLAKQHADLDSLYKAAAQQIDGEAERQRFLRTRPR